MFYQNPPLKGRAAHPTNPRFLDVYARHESSQETPFDHPVGCQESGNHQLHCLLNHALGHAPHLETPGS